MNYTTMMKDSAAYIESFKDSELTADSIGHIYSYTGAYFCYLFSTFYEDTLPSFLDKVRKEEGEDEVKTRIVPLQNEITIEYEEIVSFYIGKRTLSADDEKGYYDPICRIAEEYEDRCRKGKLTEDDAWIAMWRHDESYTPQYLYGKQYDRGKKMPKSVEKIIVPSGNYAVFSKHMQGSEDSLGEQMKQLILYAYGVWLPRNQKRRNRWGFAFEKYQNGKVFFYLPLLEEEKQETEGKIYSVDVWTQYIDEHITENLTTTGLAETFHYSPTHFRRVFRYYYKMSVSDYIRQRRLDMAAADIRKGMKCKEAAAKYSFSTYAGFSRAFQKEFNMTPMEYGKSMVEIVDLAQYYEEYKDMLMVTYINMKETKMIGYPVLAGKSEDADIPAQVCYWMDKEFPCLENTRFSCNIQRREEKIALWYYAPEHRYIEYILGPVVEEFDDDIPEEMLRVTIKGGRYAVFETDKKSDKDNLPETIRMYARCVFYGWVKEHRNRVDLSRITFERYIDNKVYFCVPIKY